MVPRYQNHPPGRDCRAAVMTCMPILAPMNRRVYNETVLGNIVAAWIVSGGYRARFSHRRVNMARHVLRHDRHRDRGVLSLVIAGGSYGVGPIQED